MKDIFSKKESLIGGMILGVVAFVIGLIYFINLMQDYFLYGFKFSYLRAIGFKPAWLFSLGMAVGGAAGFYESFKKFKKLK